MRDVRGRAVPKGAKSLTARSPQGRRNTKMLTHACDSRCGQRRAQQLLAAHLAHSAPCRTQRPSELSAVWDFAPFGTQRRSGLRAVRDSAPYATRRDRVTPVPIGSVAPHALVRSANPATGWYGGADDGTPCSWGGVCHSPPISATSLVQESCQSHDEHAKDKQAAVAEIGAA